jgi:hypothetical protein
MSVTLVVLCPYFGAQALVRVAESFMIVQTILKLVKRYRKYKGLIVVNSIIMILWYATLCDTVPQARISNKERVINLLVLGQ